jgi:hypothetical protein
MVDNEPVSLPQARSMAADAAAEALRRRSALADQEELSAPANDDELVEAYIHTMWCAPTVGFPCPACVGEVGALVRAALRIHAPCHDATTEPWGCTRSQPW